MQCQVHAPLRAQQQARKQLREVGPSSARSARSGEETLDPDLDGAALQRASKAKLTQLHLGYRGARSRGRLYRSRLGKGQYLADLLAGCRAISRAADSLGFRLRSWGVIYDAEWQDLLSPKILQAIRSATGGCSAGPAVPDLLHLRMADLGLCEVAMSPG
eukprot:7653352-Pyramimonas_sp.AAC.1